MAEYRDDETHDDIWPRGLAAKRAASWWDAAKAYCRSDRERNRQLAALHGQLDDIRAVLAEFATHSPFHAPSLGHQFVRQGSVLDRIDAILAEPLPPLSDSETGPWTEVPRG